MTQTFIAIFLFASCFLSNFIYYAQASTFYIEDSLPSRFIPKHPEKVKYLSFWNYTDTLCPNNNVLLFKSCKSLILYGKQRTENQNSKKTFYYNKIYFDVNLAKLLPKLSVVELSYFDINDLESIEGLSNLQELTINAGAPAVLPDNIGKLKRLKKLRLNSNNLSGLSDSIKHLDSLTELSISSTSFGAFPTVLTELKSIKTVSLFTNINFKWCTKELETFLKTPTLKKVTILVKDQDTRDDILYLMQDKSLKKKLNWVYPES